MVHESAVSQSVDLYLRSLLRNRQDKLVALCDFWFLVITTYEVQVTTSGCVDIMDHGACLSSDSLRRFSNLLPTLSFFVIPSSNEDVLS